MSSTIDITCEFDSRTDEFVVSLNIPDLGIFICERISKIDFPSYMSLIASSVEEGLIKEDHNQLLSILSETWNAHQALLN